MPEETNEPKVEGAQDNPPETKDEGNPPDPKPGEKKQDSDDDKNDPLAGLTPKELRRIIADTEKSKKDVEAERDSFKTKVDESERATRSKEENLERDLTKERDRNKTLLAVNSRLAIINGILSEKKWTWHNPEIVAAQLDPSVVKVGEDGKIEGLVKDLARVAKDHAYLLANVGVGQQSPTGVQPGQGSSNSGRNKTELAKEYPALLGRI